MHSADASDRCHFALSSLRYLVDLTFGLLMTSDDQTPLHGFLKIMVSQVAVWRVAFHSVRNISSVCGR